jgi:hypothetical protein
VIFFDLCDCCDFNCLNCDYCDFNCLNCDFCDFNYLNCDFCDFCDCCDSEDFLFGWFLQLLVQKGPQRGRMFIETDDQGMHDLSEVECLVVFTRIPSVQYAFAIRVAVGLDQSSGCGYYLFFNPKYNSSSKV